MISFAKYQCAGNDFIILPQGIEIGSEIVPNLCHRRFGIGADGVLMWTPESSGFRFRIFNTDGSEAAMCGNGLRCLAHALSQEHGSTLTLYSQKRTHQCHIDGSIVEVELGKPDWKHAGLSLGEGLPTVAVIDTGVPHAVFSGEGFDQYAKTIRSHKALQPGGANVTAIEDRFLRTFERGVEDETYSCGTGAAAALAYLQRKQGINEYTATFRRGTTLHQRFQNGSIFQSAPVYQVFHGMISLSR